MKNTQKDIVKLSAAVIITVLTFSVFSMDLGLGIPPIGNLLFPGNGLWKVTGEVPAEERINIPTLSDDVTVIRDEWGIPHIYAADEGDLSFALGYVHAQDRLFQMDLARRNIRGKMAEIPGIYSLYGDRVLYQDKFQLASGKEYWANQTLKKAWEMQDDGEIDFMDDWVRYVDGVNYYINKIKLTNEKPLEYHLLGFEPTEWTILDSFCFSKYMSEMLTWDYGDLSRLAGFESLSNSEETSGWWDEIFDPSYPYEIPIVPEYGDYSNPPVPSGSQSSGTRSPLLKTISDFISSVSEIDSQKELLKPNNWVGSNNWVIDGNKSNTGYPIVCNDMHLAQNLPGIWYEAHLVSSDTNLNTYGFTLAGVPIPIVGHNDYLAWGNTNTGYDVIDWYYFNEINDTHYIYNNTITEYTFRSYNIKISGGVTEEFTVKETVHGPVMNDFLGSQIPESLGGQNIVIVPKWTANNITYEMVAIHGFNHAHNRQEFNEASEYFHNPAQNIVYGDRYGNIAIRPTGLVPIRDDSKIPDGYLGNGTLPYNGSNGEGEWIGYVPFEDIPDSINPDQGYLVSANQIATGPEYTEYYLQGYKGNGYRARRINEFLNESVDGTVSVEMMKKLQFDVHSSLAKAFTPYLINATSKVIADLGDWNYENNISVFSNVLSEISSWDYEMNKSLAAPTIYRKWRDLFRSATFGDESYKYDASISPSWNILENLMRQNTDSHWFNDVSTTSTVETMDDIILTALDDTITFLKNYYASNNPTDWKWGQIHFLEVSHLLGLDSLGYGPVSVDGEGYTVNPAGVSISSGAGTAHGGASERMIVDFSDINNSISVIPSGQRGLSNSKHYSDQLEQLFLQGKYHYQYFTNTADDFPADSIESRIYFSGGA
ncbi:MAG: penicillin acylase family protein [Promethearchaeota archaeon]